MAESIHVKLPDGSVKEVPKGTTALDIAKAIKPAASGCRFGSQNQWRYYRSHEAADKDTDLRLLNKKILRPSKFTGIRPRTCWLQRPRTLFRRPSLRHGPPTETGFFFYDFYRPTVYSGDWKRSRRRAELVQQNIPYAREFLPREQGLAAFKKEGDFMKCHFIEQFTKPEKRFRFIARQVHDFCRGPHIINWKIKAFKLIQHCGCLLLGDEKNPQLQRIYGLRFSRRQISTTILISSKRQRTGDHRVLGPAARLVFDSGAGRAGLIFWHPKGGIIRKRWKTGCVNT